MNNIKFWLKGARVYTLPIGLVPVIMAVVVAIRMTKYASCKITSANITQFIIQSIFCIGVVLFLQISVNYANDYCDGIKGLDDKRYLRAVGNNNSGNANNSSKKSLCDVSWKLADAGITRNKVRNAMIITALLGCVCGLIVTYLSGLWFLVIVGILCLAAAWFYAGGKHPYGYRGLGEVSAFTFFGPVAFIGTLCAISYGIGVSSHVTFSSPWLVIACFAMSCIPGGCSACLMMINNLRDISTDKEHGKITVMVKIGEKAGQNLCSAFVAMILILMVFYDVASIVFPSVLPSAWYFNCAKESGFISSGAGVLAADLMSNSLRFPLLIVQCIMQLIILVFMFIKGFALVRVLHKSDYRSAFPLCVAISMLCAVSTLLSLIS